MKIRILSIIAAAMAAILATLAVPTSASALGNGRVNNTVHNHWDSLGNVKAWYGSAGTLTMILTPGNATGNNAQCFYPTKDSHSQWGGFYAAGVIRCFTSDNNYLFLHVGR